MKTIFGISTLQDLSGTSLMTSLFLGLIPVAMIYVNTLRATGGKLKSIEGPLEQESDTTSTSTSTSDLHPNAGKITFTSVNRKSGYIGVTPTAVLSRPQVLSNNCFVEISLSDITSCINAARGGANSIELCCDRAEGGTTPSYGLIAAAARRFRYSDVSINVLIRPRGGDFVYSDAEMECVLQDVCACRDLGVDGKRTWEPSSFSFLSIL